MCEMSSNLRAFLEESAASSMEVMMTYIQGGSKSNLLILSEYVNKTEKIGGMWTGKNSYRDNEVLSDIFTWNNLGHNGFMFKYSMTESSQWNYC